MFFDNFINDYKYYHGVSEVLGMFLAEPPCDPEDLDEFIDFASHWLCADPNRCIIIY
jgi:hypothetical protein